MQQESPKQNNFTILFSSQDSSLSINYCLVEKFLMVNENQLAIITSLSIYSTGPQHQFHSDTVTADTQKTIFNDYVQYEYGDMQCIFVKQILQKCCNLSNHNCKILTAPINSGAIE